MEAMAHLEEAKGCSFCFLMIISLKPVGNLGPTFASFPGLPFRMVPGIDEDFDEIELRQLAILPFTLA